MKQIVPFLLLLVFLACQNTEKISPNIGQKPDEVLAQKMLGKIIRYAAKLPPKGATHENKFDPKFDEHYQKQAEEHRIDLYHRDSATSDIYLLVSRIAPSMTVKRVGTGIHLRMAGDSITYYNEVFRTWKMPEETLAQKGALLFSKMVRGEDLTPYYNANSGKEEYIEFPDDNVRFDTEKRVWISGLGDLLEDYR
ncbi:MAG: hypothetical protein Q7U74_04410 [Saprospiraceae bacterium]|nr:hypothetical protein [Saprospiraceae bacterium]